MLRLTIEANTITELHDKLRQMLPSVTVERDAETIHVGGFTLPAVAASGPDAAVTLPSAPEKQSRRGRPPKNKAAGDVAVESADPKASSDAAAPSIAGPATAAASTEASATSHSEPVTTGVSGPDDLTVFAATLAHAAESIADSPAPTAPTHTIDDCRVALQAVNERHGLPGCMALLQEFGVNRVSLVAPEKFADFIARCQAKAAQ